MEIKELRKKPHLSHSSINSYMECGLQYKFSKIDKLKPQFISDNLVYGITVHRVLADFHQERLIGKLLSSDDLCDLFGQYWKSAAENKESHKVFKEKQLRQYSERRKSVNSRLPQASFRKICIPLSQSRNRSPSLSMVLTFRSLASWIWWRKILPEPLSSLKTKPAPGHTAIVRSIKICS